MAGSISPARRRIKKEGAGVIESFTVLGIDTSSVAIHACLLRSDGTTMLFKWSAKGKVAEQRFYPLLESFKRGLMDIKKQEKVNFIAIERPLYSQNPKTTIILSKIVGGVEYIVEGRAIRYETVDNRTWKKEILGSGANKISKDDVMKFAQDYFKQQFTEQDYADASCIALWAQKKGRIEVDI